MNLEATAIPSITAPREATNIRTWSDGPRRSRADAPMVSSFDVNTVDAVFEESSLSFLGQTESTTERTIENLTAELSALEAQCAKLRELLEQAAINRSEGLVT